MAFRSVVLPVGHEHLSLQLPDEQLAWVLAPQSPPALPDVAAALAAALAAPTGCAPLSDLVRGREQDVLILVDDDTRPTPQHQLLPTVLDTLNAAGVPDSQISLLVALGTHRAHTAAESRRRYGPEVADRVRVENLDQRDEAFADLGVTASGIPIRVSKRYRQASFRLAVGNIVPHMYCGWSGGSKMVQPGVCSHATTAETHLMAAPLVREILGQLANPVRHEIDQIGQSSGLDFIVNTVLNGAGQVAHLVAGDVIAAHRQGVDLARAVYGAVVPELVDLVIASSHPADRDFWQACKALNAAGLAVRAGGTIILLNPAHEGVAPDHPAMVDLGVTPIDQVRALLERHEIDDRVAAATYQAMAATRDHARAVVVSDPIARADLEAMGLAWQPDAQAAIDAAIEQLGPQARIGVLPQAADMLPLIGKGARHALPS